jgi:hypothetical protein
MIVESPWSTHDARPGEDDKEARELDAIRHHHAAILWRIP